MWLGQDDIADLEGDVGAILRLAEVEDDVPPSIDVLSQRLLNGPIQRVPRRALRWGEGSLSRVGDRFSIFVADDLSAERARFVAAHEFGHWWHRVHLRAPEDERRCDAFGALLVAPRRAVQRVVKAEGHAVSRLAAILRVPQGLALLRLGETTGRPVALVRPAPIVRGGDFAWPENLTTARRIRGAHPIRVDGSMGWMALAA